jgi:hypothetical protein
MTDDPEAAFGPLSDWKGIVLRPYLRYRAYQQSKGECYGDENI